MPDHVGQQLDQYHLEQRIGIGTFGEVYLAEHIQTHSRVAVKTLHIHPTPDELKRFLQEARLGMVHLKHPHIVPLLDFGIEQDIPFLVMDYAPNGTLRQKHPLGEQLSLELVASYVIQMSSALQHAHDRRLIHRDVKPQNMLLGSRGQVLLSDFGIATIAHSEHSLVTQEMAGSANYIAPEQVRGKPLPASDQYALAICVYEWLAGVHPFKGTVWDVLHQHLHQPPPPLRTHTPGLPKGIEAAVMVALSKDPAQRFASIHAFAAAFEHVCRSVGIAPISPYVPIQNGPPIGDWTCDRCYPLRSTSPDDNEEFEPTLPLPDLSRRGTSNASSSIPSASAPARRIPIGRIALFSVLILLLVGSAVLLYPPYIGPYIQSFVRTNNAHATATMLAKDKATATADLQEYTQAIKQKGIMFGFDAAHSRTNPYEKTLSANTLPAQKPLWTYTTRSVVSSEAVVADGVVYVGSDDHRLYAFDAACISACKPLWNYLTPGVLDSSPAVAGGIVYVGSGDHQLYAFDAACRKSCEPIWTYETGDVIDSSPVVAGGMVYVGSDDGILYVFDAACRKKCKPIWHFSTQDVVASSPAVGYGKVFVGSANGSLYVFSATCRKDCLPLGVVAIGDSTLSSPIIVDGKVYVGSEDGTLYAFDAQCSAGTCPALWTSKLGSSIITSSAATDGLLYVGAADGRIYAFDTACKQNCQPLRTFTVGELHFSSPTLANGLLFVGGENHTLSNFDAHCQTSTCVPLWISEEGANAAPGRLPSSNAVSTFMDSSPAVVNGIIYVGSADGQFYAFGVAA